MPFDPFVGVDLIIVSTFECLITKEMDLVEIFLFQMPEAVSLVPTCWEDIEGNLTADGVGKAEVGEVGPKGFDKLLANLVLFVINFVFVTFGVATVTADWRYVDHTVTEFDEGTAKKQREMRASVLLYARSKMDLTAFWGYQGQQCT